MDKSNINLIKNNFDKVNFVLDSGAFTAWKSGKPIALDDYCKFIESLPFKPWRYFMLDVIGDAKGTLKNYELMLKRGFNPIPVFTRGEDLSVLEEYYKTSDVVGIGGLVGTQGNKGFVKGIMSKIGSRKVHWLGFTSHDFLTVYKPFMCDSSSWLTTSRFGTSRVYLGSGQFKAVRDNDFLSPDSALMHACQRLKVEINSLKDQRNWTKGMRYPSLLSAASSIKYSFDVKEKLGVNLFMVMNVSYYTSILLEAYERLEGLN